MKIKMQQTSLFAYDELVRSGKINKNEQKVLAVIANIGPCTDREIADVLGWTINRVNGRRNGLMNKKIVTSDYGKKYRGNRPSMAWRVVREGEQVDLPKQPLKARILAMMESNSYTIKELMEASEILTSHAHGLQQ